MEADTLLGIKQAFDDIEAAGKKAFELINGMTERHLQKMSDESWILNLKKAKSCHKDGETPIQHNGTQFYTLYLHKDHILFLDWLLDHTREHTNMLYSVTLSHEIKNATAALCRKIELEESIERNRVETNACYCCQSKQD